jgi:ribosome-associated protein
MGAEDLRVLDSLLIPGAELEWAASRSSGPGGQNVNKLSTRVSLRWRVTTSGVLSDSQRARLLSKLGSRLTKEGELLVHGDGCRSQLDNRRAARDRLAQLVRDALHVPKSRRATRPTLGSKRRRLDAKKQRGQTKRQRGRPPGEE